MMSEDFAPQTAPRLREGSSLANGREQPGGTAGISVVLAVPAVFAALFIGYVLGMRRANRKAARRIMRIMEPPTTAVQMALLRGWRHVEDAALEADTCRHGEDPWACVPCGYRLDEKWQADQESE